MRDPAPFSIRALARWSEGSSQLALFLASGCREVYPGRLSPASGSFSPSFTRMALSPILRTVSESAWTEAAQLPKQAWRENRLAAEAVPLTRIAWAIPPGQWVPQSCSSRGDAHGCPATSSKATSMCKHTAEANQQLRLHAAY